MVRNLTRMLAVLLLWLGNVDATWHVTSDPNDPIDRIGRVVAQTGDGDSILIGPGTYYEHIPLPEHSITLIGTEGAQATILDGAVPIDGRQGSILYHFASQGLTTTIRGLTFAHGSGSALQHWKVGGAIAYGSSPAGGATLDIGECVFRENDVTLAHPFCSGGAIWISFSDLELRACEFMANQASVGVDLTYDGPTQCKIDDCDFLLNGNWHDAVFSEFGQHLTITKSRFVAESPGFGAIYWIQGRTVRLEDNWFEDRSGSHVAGITLLSEELDFRRNVLIVRDPSAQGMSLKVYEGRATIIGNDFINADLLMRPFWLQFEQNIFVRGSAEAGGEGGGIIHCNDLWPDAGCVHVDGDYIVANNISADPLFCDEAGGDLHLQMESPCAPPNAPEGCGLIGVFDPACGGTPTRKVSWGQLKQLFR